MEEATGAPIEAAAEEAANFAKQNDARVAENLSKTPAISRVANTIKGYVMEQRDQSKPADAPNNTVVRTEVQALAIGLPVIALLVAWRWRARRR
jgi:hypothetical protein